MEKEEKTECTVLSYISYESDNRVEVYADIC